MSVEPISSRKNARPQRGEIWWVKLDPIRNHQTVINRPCLVISVNQINSGAANIIIGIPIEFENQGIASHIPVNPHNLDIRSTGYIHCEDIRKIPIEWIESCAGVLPADTMTEVEETVSLLLGLG
ncbi:MAG: type II toxin-antitoxin system PemK/MazF family toxin [Balneolales bacterium]